MLKFNSFRAMRYMRSRFVEGKYLLANEATDLELELLDILKTNVKSILGDIAIDSSWKCEVLSNTEILVRPGEAWYEGLPFIYRSGKDHLISGNNLSIGIVPAGVTVQDSTNGKIITFNDGATTPSNNYKVVITAQEELVTYAEDPFLKNANITESTAQKLRLVYKINVIQTSAQNPSPIPYTDETSSPSNLQSSISILPSIGSGDFVSSTPLSGSEAIDGRDIEIIINNPVGVNPIPTSTSQQAAFSNGTLIDSKGQRYHINVIFNDTVAGKVVIRVDKEVGQPDPEIITGLSYSLIKKEVYVTDDLNGVPQGKLYWPIASLIWNSATGFTHSSKVSDLRTRVTISNRFQEETNKKFGLVPTGGGDISFDLVADSTLDWTSNIYLINAFGATQTISTGYQAIIEDGALVYDMNTLSGGIISRGIESVTILSAGSTLNLNALDDLSDVRIGNIIKIGAELATITDIDDVAKQVDVTPAIVGTGAAEISKDSFASGMAILDVNSYVLAVRKSNKIYIGSALELESGEENQIGDGVPSALLTFLGALDENDNDPNYSSTNIVTQGTSLVTAISALDAALSGNNYDERILYPAGLTSGTPISLPINSITALPESYIAADKDLKIFHNQLFKFQSVDWTPLTGSTLSFTYNLSNDSEVHFRKDTGISGGGGGGGSDSLQSAYNTGNIISVVTGVPVTINGTSGKLLVVNGDMEVTGVIDPLGVQLTPTGINPLSIGQKGIWINISEELIVEGASTKNISQSINNLEAGLGLSALTRYMQNTSGSTINAGTPVYSPLSGEIALAVGTAANTSRVIGITLENINHGNTGKVAYQGIIPGIVGFTQGSYIYLDQVAGQLTDVEPDIGSYPAGFHVVKVGVIDGTNLLLQIQHIGVLQ